MKRALWLVAILALGGCTHEQAQLPLVSAVTARADSMPHNLYVTGELRARKSATLTTTHPGIVERVAAVEGNHVSAGEPLIWLHPGTLPNEIAQKAATISASQAKVAGLRYGISNAGVKNKGDIAQAQEALVQANIAIDQSEKELQNAQKDMLRKKELVQEKSLALVEYERATLTWKEKGDALKAARSKAAAAQESLKLARAANTDVQQTDLAAAEASLNQARIDLQGAQGELAKTVLRSPIDGVVVESKVQAGQLLGGGGESLVTVVDNSQLDLYVTVDQSDAGRMLPNLKAEMQTELVPGQTFPIHLVELIPVTDPKTNTVRARFALDAHHPRLLHGTKVRVKATLSVDKGILVARDCLRTDATNHAFVQVVLHDKQIQHKAVHVLDADETHVLLALGEVQPGETVVTAGGDALKDGTQVAVRIVTY